MQRYGDYTFTDVPDLRADGSPDAAGLGFWRWVDVVCVAAGLLAAAVCAAVLFGRT